MEKQLFTISVFSENNVGVLNQVTIIFTRRCINLESISASPTSIPGIHSDIHRLRRPPPDGEGGAADREANRCHQGISAH